MIHFTPGRIGVLVSCALMLVAPSASACWDGSQANIDRVTISFGGDGKPSLQEELLLARWGTKLNALLPPGWTLNYHVYAGNELCRPKTPDDVYELINNCRDVPESVRDKDTKQAELAALFSYVARETGASPQKANAALGTPTRLYFVQVASSRTKAFAQALTNRLLKQDQDDELPWSSDNFYEAGGFPGPSQSPIRMMTVMIDGVPFHRVVVGTFATAQQARDYQATVEASGTAATITFRDIG